MRNLTSNPKSIVSFFIAFLLIYGWQDAMPNKAFAQTGQFVQEMTNVDKVFSDFMNDWSIPGGSIAIVKDGHLVYARGFGYANRESNELIKPDHLFRIASVSKPVTAIAIMKLIDEGAINVNAKVFGTDGILNGPNYNNILDPRVKSITVRHLLHHTSGWGFINRVDDPMFLNQRIARQVGENPPVGSETIIKFMLRTQTLDNKPGTNYFYSNFGFCILGRIIEKISGKSYENYIKTELLSPLGITEMQLGQNLYKNKAPNEVKYYDFPGAPLVSSIYGTGGGVPFPYGGFNIEAMDSHGGWIASVIDLVKLLVAVDGYDTKPDILNQASIQLMTTPSTANSGYGMGWAVNQWGNWWHIGDLPGTSSILVRTSNGLGWAVLFNTRPSNSQDFVVQMDNMVWEAIKGIDAWPTHDLFEPVISVDVKVPTPSKSLIPDPNLAAAVREELGLAPNASITEQQLKRLATLDAVNRRIKNLTGLEYATQLKELNLNRNQISDVSPLAGLTQLEKLYLLGNQIGDVSPLAGLTRLKELRLNRNEIRDVSTLAGLVNLEKLRLAENPITDASPLAGLTKLIEVDIEIPTPSKDLIPDARLAAAVREVLGLAPKATITEQHLKRLATLDAANRRIENLTGLEYATQLKELDLNRNQISDVSPLAGLTQLEQLLLTSNQISDVSPLAGLTQLEKLYLLGNKIEDVSPLAGLTRLKELRLNRNEIRDVSTLAGLINLEKLRLAENPITDASPLAGLTKLVDVDIEISTSIAEDINADGIINIQDLVLVATNFGQTGENDADVNADGVVDIRDLVKVAGAFGTAAAAPSVNPQVLEMFTTTDVRNWLSKAQSLGLTDVATQRGIGFLEQLLAVLIPNETVLLSNYPNPFNPETWIPYQLAKPTDVTLTIYNVRGIVVRRLALGHQAAGVYHNRSHAVYWDGKNAFGESVASGLYFYTLTAGDFTATRKMVIRK